MEGEKGTRETYTAEVVERMERARERMRIDDEAERRRK